MRAQHVGVISFLQHFQKLLASPALSMYNTLKPIPHPLSIRESVYFFLLVLLSCNGVVMFELLTVICLLKFIHVFIYVIVCGYVLCEFGCLRAWVWIYVRACVCTKCMQV